MGSDPSEELENDLVSSALHGERGRDDSGEIFVLNCQSVA